MSKGILIQIPLHHSQTYMSSVVNDYEWQETGKMNINNEKLIISVIKLRVAFFGGHGML